MEVKSEEYLTKIHRQNITIITSPVQVVGFRILLGILGLGIVVPLVLNLLGIVVLTTALLGYIFRVDLLLVCLQNRFLQLHFRGDGQGEEGVAVFLLPIPGSAIPAETEPVTEETVPVREYAEETQPTSVTEPNVSETNTLRQQTESGGQMKLSL